jgi:carnitine-CoA ligase
VVVWHRASEGTVNVAFEAAVADHADDLFLDFGRQSYSYGQTDQRIAQLAHLLHTLGVGRGDTVVTVLDNSIEAVISLFAANRLGAICVPVNTAYRGEFLKHQINDCGARVAIAETDYTQRILDIAERLPKVEAVLYRGEAHARPTTPPRLRLVPFDEALDEQPATSIRVDVAPSELSTLIYTAGTTGPSKGCMVSHGYTLNLARQYLQVTTRRSDEHSWTPLPLFHFNAWTCSVVATAVLGSSATIAARFSVSGFWPEIERTKARIATLLGPMVSLLAQAPDTPEMTRCHGQLRVVQSSPFPREFITIWRERFGAQLAGSNAFGLTECCLTTHIPLDQPAPPGSSGRPNEDFDVRIFDEHDNELPAGEAGEIVVRPKRPHVMFDGYWNRPDATAALTPNLWFHTGDIGKFDSDGYFYFVDRKRTIYADAERTSRHTKWRPRSSHIPTSPRSPCMPCPPMSPKTTSKSPPSLNPVRR